MCKTPASHLAGLRLLNAIGTRLPVLVLLAALPSGVHPRIVSP
ncbi:hypothetical protein [Streptomyces sp. NPDC050759]